MVDPPKYVGAMLAYCRAMQKRTGAPPDVVGIQNEIHQPAPLWYEMTTTLRKELDKAGFKDVRIHMSDGGRLHRGIEWLKDLRQSPEAWAATDYVASHLYDYQGLFHRSRRDSTRNCSSGRNWPTASRSSRPSSASIRRLSVEELPPGLFDGPTLSQEPRVADAAAICYCWTLVNVVQPSYGWTRTLLVPDPSQGFVPKASSHQLRVFGAFSRRVREGMVRVEARSDDPDLFASAFSAADGKKTVILVNRSTAPRAE